MLHAIFVQPLTNLLFLLVSFLPKHDFGIAVILLTAFIRLILWPIAAKQLHSQKALTAIQPEVNRLKQKYKNDPQKFNQATMELYKEKEVNPFSSCLPLLIQMPFLIGIFYVFKPFANPAYADLSNPNGIVGQLYPFIKSIPTVSSYIASTKAISTMFLGLVDLAKPNVWLAGIAAIGQFVQSKMLLPKGQVRVTSDGGIPSEPIKGNDPTAMMTKQMAYFFPILTFIIALRLPSALPLYWSVTTGFAILQQYLILHRDVEKIEEEAAIETASPKSKSISNKKPRGKKNASKRK